MWVANYVPIRQILIRSVFNISHLCFSLLATKFLKAWSEHQNGDGYKKTAVESDVFPRCLYWCRVLDRHGFVQRCWRKTYKIKEMHPNIEFWRLKSWRENIKNYSLVLVKLGSLSKVVGSSLGCRGTGGTSCQKRTYSLTITDLCMNPF